MTRRAVLGGISSFTTSIILVSFAYGDPPSSVGPSEAKSGEGKSVSTPHHNEVRHAILRQSKQSIAEQKQSLIVRDEKGEPRPILAMDASTDGRYLVIAADDHVLRLIDIASWSEIGRGTQPGLGYGHSDRVRSVAFDATGEHCASVGNDGRLILWQVQDGGLKKLRVMSGTPALAAVCYSSNSNQLAAGGFVDKIYQLSMQGHQARHVSCRHVDIRSVAFCADGRLAAAGRGGSVHIFNGLKESRKIQANSGSINAITFLSESARLVSVCDDGEVTQSDIASGRVISRVPTEHGRLFAVAALSSDRVAVAGSDDTIRIVDWSAGGVVDRLHGHRGSVAALAVANGDLISAGFDATVCRWSIDHSSYPPTLDGRRKPQVALKRPVTSEVK